jgi:acetyl-CoA C-acetyltransferase
MSREKAEELGVKPLARIVSYADAATAPIDFTIAPAKALPIALEKAGLTHNDISKYELNEAFSVVARVNEKVYLKNTV